MVLFDPGFAGSRSLITLLVTSNSFFSGVLGGVSAMAKLARYLPSRRRRDILPRYAHRGSRPVPRVGARTCLALGQTCLEGVHQVDDFGLRSFPCLWRLHVQGVRLFLADFFLDPTFEVGAVAVLEVTGHESARHLLDQALRHGELGRGYFTRCGFLVSG